MQTAYERGRQDYTDGKAMSDNPYRTDRPAPFKPYGLYKRSDSDSYFVINERGEVVAELVQAFPGKWKIRYEDIYAKTPMELALRLYRRGA